MHRLVASPGGWDPSVEGVIFVEQTPAPIVFLTAADTEIQTLAGAIPQLPSDFPSLRAANLLQLQQQLTVDTYAETALIEAKVIIVRLLGGRSYWPYGIEVLKELAEENGTALIFLPGDDRPDPDLISHSTVPLAIANRLWRYLCEGGVDNLHQALRFLGQQFFDRSEPVEPPQAVPNIGCYEAWQSALSPSPSPKVGRGEKVIPTAGLLFYRSHYLSGNTAPIAALCQALTERGIRPIPLYVSSLRAEEIKAAVLEEFNSIQLILNTTGFAIDDSAFWQKLNVPVLQVICSGGPEERWRENWQGLSPQDMAMNVALPEVDGRIISRAVSFKSVAQRNEALETDVVTYQPVGDRIHFVADLAKNWINLGQTPITQRKVALILANYPTRDGRLANGVGLDTPESCINLLKAMQAGGYDIPQIPENGTELINWLTAGPTNDPEGQGIRPVAQSLTLADYQRYFEQLPEPVRSGMEKRWGPPAISETQATWEIPTATAQGFPIPGIQLGNVFVGIQPSRGYDKDPSLNYHAPDLEPTHEYLAFYQWLRTEFGTQAIAHVGKHGNLEWLPGKSIALSEDCYPEVALGPLPHLYPFIVNDPGEGSQAKRRSGAVIIDHLTPPLTRAELYGPLTQLEGLVDEYYSAQQLDPTRVALIRDRILTLLNETNLAEDLQLTASVPAARPGADLEERKAVDQRFEAQVLNELDTYLCELKEAQIRDGLHVLGQCPEERQLRDLAIAIARMPGTGQQGLTRAIAEDWGLDWDPLTVEMGEALSAEEQAVGKRHQQDPPQSPLLKGGSGASDELPKITAIALRTTGDLIEQIETQAAHWLDQILNAPPQTNLPLSQRGTEGDQPCLHPKPGPQAHTALTWITQTLLPNLHQTTHELTQFLNGLNAHYVPAGPSGAPTRGRADVLPTGRNFYSVDIRGLPTETAWDVGRKAADAVIERYCQDEGDYPQTLALSMWGTATMRTGGDDMAEALALMGVQPMWDGPSRRVVDFEILPLSLLERPRVDVTLRISGFFRDAFPNLIDLFDQAVAAVAALDEPDAQNPLAARVKAETEEWIEKGLDEEEAGRRSRYRIFGSKPGAYGAGLQGLIEAQNWTSDADLAQAYINWSSYAYSSTANSSSKSTGSTSTSGAGQGHAAPEAFQQRLKNLQIVLHNQDNREHDLLDSDDYYQFHGGLTAAARTAQGVGEQPVSGDSNDGPQIYFGDHAQPAKPKVRPLSEEISRVYRSRVINPKWIAGVMRHGYKGAFEMAATVDYLFAYDATTHTVADHMYEGVAQAYILDDEVQAFTQQHNPWALRDMAERLLEAEQRGLWKQADTNLLSKLRNVVLQAEEKVERRSSHFTHRVPPSA